MYLFSCAAAASKGFWAEMLGVGDFYYEVSTKAFFSDYVPVQNCIMLSGVGFHFYLPGPRAEQHSHCQQGDKRKTALHAALCLVVM